VSPLQTFSRFALSIPLIVALAGCGRLPSGPRHMEAGKKMMAKKDYERAILEFRSAAAALPRDAEPFYQLGMAYEGTADPKLFPLAVKSLQHALQLDPKHATARLELARLEALTRNEEALKDAESSLKDLLSESGTNVDALSILAVAELKLGKNDEAAANLAAALETAPQDIRSAILLATVKSVQGDLKGAEEILQKAIAASPGSPIPLIELGRLYRGTGRLVEAAGQARKALDVSPKNVPATLLLGETQLAMGRTGDAEQTFKRVAALDNDATKDVYALFLFQTGRRDEGVREFERVAAANPNNRNVRSDLVTAYFLTGRTADAQKALASALKKNPKDTDALLQRAELLAQAGDYPRAELDLNEVLHLKPDSSEVHYLLARVHRARGEDLSYRQELTEALKARPTAISVRVELAQALLASNDPKAAIRVLDEAPDSQKSAPALLAQRNWALLTEGDMGQLRKGIDAGLASQKSPEFLSQDGYWKLRTGDYKGAVAAFNAALKVAPDSVVALDGLRQSHLALKEGKVGLEQVKAYAAKAPKSSAVQGYLGQLLLQNGDPEGARAALTAAKEANPNSFSSDLALVQLDISQNRFDDAMAKLQMVVAKDPRNSTAQLWMGNLAETKGDHKAATAAYRKSVEINSNNAMALNNLAYSLSEYANSPDEALKLVQQAKEIASNNPDYTDTLGWVLYRKGLYDGAVRELEAAASRKDAKPAWKYHLAMAYFKAGNRSKADATFDAALKQNPNAPEAKAARDLLGRAN
jgi:tetratricopeptide (TPR) repeat protein